MAKTSKIISIHDAKVRSMTVEIKALTVDGRQVTLAVYRQLPIYDLINYDEGGLNGLPWGSINYCVKDCPEKPHRHYVWQLGDELRRCAIEDVYRPKSVETEAVARWARAELSEAIRTVIKQENIAWQKKMINGEFRPREKQSDCEIAYDYIKRAAGIWDKPKDDDPRLPFRPFGYPEIAKEPLWVSMQGQLMNTSFYAYIAVDLHYTGPSASSLLPAVKADIQKHIACHGRIQGHIENLKNLPQLFVAV